MFFVNDRRRLRDLEPPDLHHLHAAEGWLGLDDPVEAEAELARIAPQSAHHPDVLEVRWMLHAHGRHWADALTVAGQLTEIAPERPSGWIDRSYALHELKRTREASALLEPVAERFQGISTIPYNLACYACQLGDLESSKAWLARAVQIAGKDAIRSMALQDADLEPLWEYLRRL